MHKTPATLEACAIDLSNAGPNATALIDGLTPADPAAMATVLIGDNASALGL